MRPISSETLIELSIELAQSLTSNDRFNRLLSTIKKTIPCEAVAVLAYKEEYLTPLAFQGLSSDTLGRRFIIDDHPRLKRICASKKSIRFPAHCDLPDPYDGLLIDHSGDLPIHACMGIPLHFDNRLLGALTLDSFFPDAFDNIPQRTLDVITAMASVSLHTALAIDLLESNIKHTQQVVEELSQPNAITEQNELIGQSPSMLNLKKEISLVAPSNFNVLIEGESGSGKEIVAHQIHQQSSRNHKPIVYVNCAALPDNLIESELFGHVKGAFTGADKSRAGKFVIADGGTLFLDEIGELPLAAQSKILRAIQSNEIQAVGQDKIINVDVRIIAATNRNLALEVENDRFRADLYHRLNVFPMHVPPLRDRHGDIVLLAGFFAEKTKRKLGLMQLKFSYKTIKQLSLYGWPGNVRELEHAISRAALKACGKLHRHTNSTLTNKTVITINIDDFDQLTLLTDLPKTQVSPTIDFDTKKITNLRQEVDDFQRQLVSEILIEEKGNLTIAAKRLGIDRANLSRLSKRLGISIEKNIHIA